MKFTKKFMQELAYDYNEDAKIIEKAFVDVSRCSIQYIIVFEYQGKHYQSYYSTGSTEMQDERPYEYEGDEIECPEVVKTEKMMTIWEIKK